jgi:gamma-glutamylcyclotransferase (GGCT)/AIG2-like uncharacterized protein YtfP
VTTTLFVYGTLKKRSEAHDLLRGARYLGPASVTGALYDLGEYPGLVKKRANARLVAGELYELPDDAARTFRILDRYEGREFVRRRVFVRLKSGRRRAAWTYVLRNDPPKSARLVESGRYRLRRGAA